MENLTTVFQEILTQIYKNDISGYKNLLFIIYKNQLDLDSNLNEDIFTFLEFLFNEGVIVENNNPSESQINNTHKKEEARNKKSSFIMLPDKAFFDNITHQKILEEEKSFGNRAKKIGEKNNKARGKINYV